MKKFLLSLLCLFAAHSAHAVTLSVSDGAQKFVKAADGSLLSSTSSLVRVGFFVGWNDTTPPSATEAILKGGDLSALNSIFIPLGEAYNNNYGATSGVVIQATGALQGGISSIVADTSATANTASSVGVPVGTRLFVMVLNKSTMQAGLDHVNDTDALTQTQWALFSDSAWTMKNANMTFNVTQVAGTEIYRGTSGSILLQAAAVPEPTGVAFIVLFGATFALRRKR